MRAVFEIIKIREIIVSNKILYLILFECHEVLKSYLRLVKNSSFCYIRAPKYPISMTNLNISKFRI